LEKGQEWTMAFRDVLLGLTSYPEPTPVSVIENAVLLASSLGCHIAALACEVHVQVPGSFLASSLVNVAGLAAGEANKSRKAAEALLAAFDSIADKAGLSHERIFQKCLTHEVPDMFVEYGRLRDLMIVPVPQDYDQWYAEAVIFGTGKPILVLPEGPQKPLELNTVVVAWDFSRAAARAIADAIPILEKAREVRIVTVSNEKVLDTKHSGEELAKNLSRHGIDVILENVDAAGRSIGEVLEAYVASCSADLLVMGAYGHSRLRELILGGATKSMLSKPPLPVLFSH
jgi:nucleotide-binding universal stress UspA family protein